MLKKLISIFVGAAIPVTLAENIHNEPDVVSRVVKNGDKGYLEVDGKPFVMMGIQSFGAWQVYGNNTYSPTPDNWDTPLFEEELDWLEQTFEKAHMANFKTLQIEFTWHSIEPENEGEYDWTLIDKYVDWANKYDMYIDIVWWGLNGCGGAVRSNVNRNGFMQSVPEYIGKEDKYWAGTRNKEQWTPWLPIEGDDHYEDAVYLFEQERKAVAALFDHLAEYDKEHRVILFQAYNEPDGNQDWYTHKDIWYNMINELCRAVKESNYVVATRVNMFRYNEFNEELCDLEYVDFAGYDYYSMNADEIAAEIERGKTLSPISYIPETYGGNANITSIVATALASGGFLDFWQLNNSWAGLKHSFFGVPGTEPNAEESADGVNESGETVTQQDWLRWMDWGEWPEDGYPNYEEWELGKWPEIVPPGVPDMMNFNAGINKMSELIAVSDSANMTTFNVGEAGYGKATVPNKTENYSETQMLDNRSITYTCSDGSVGMAVYNSETNAYYIISDTSKSLDEEYNRSKPNCSQPEIGGDVPVKITADWAVSAETGYFDENGIWVKAEDKKINEDGSITLYAQECLRINAGERIEQKTKLNTAVVNDNGTYIFDISIENSSGGRLITTLYDEKHVLVALDITDGSSGSHIVKMKSDREPVIAKAMLWNNLDNMSPAATAVEIEKSEWSLPDETQAPYQTPAPTPDIEISKRYGTEYVITEDMIWGSQGYKGSSYTSAFDGNTSTYFNGFESAVIGVDLGDTLDVDAIGYYPVVDPSTDKNRDYIKGCYFEGSVDGTNYERIFTIDEDNMPQDDSSMVVVPIGDKKYRYIRLKRDTGISTNGLAASEIRIFKDYDPKEIASLSGEYDDLTETFSWHTDEGEPGVYTTADDDLYAELTVDITGGGSISEDGILFNDMTICGQNGNITPRYLMITPKENGILAFKATTSHIGGNRDKNGIAVYIAETDDHSTISTSYDSELCRIIPESNSSASDNVTVDLKKDKTYIIYSNTWYTGRYNAEFSDLSFMADHTEDIEPTDNPNETEPLSGIFENGVFSWKTSNGGSGLYTTADDDAYAELTIVTDVNDTLSADGIYYSNTTAYNNNPKTGNRYITVTPAVDGVFSITAAAEKNGSPSSYGCQIMYEVDVEPENTDYSNKITDIISLYNTHDENRALQTGTIDMEAGKTYIIYSYAGKNDTFRLYISDLTFTPTNVVRE